MEKEIHKKKILSVFPLVIIVILFFVVVASTLPVIFQLKKENTILSKQVEEDHKKFLLLTPTPTQPPKNIFGDIDEEVKKMFSGKREFTSGKGSYIDIEGDTLKMSRQEESFELMDKNNPNRRKYHVAIDAYKYTPGLQYTNGYEGSTWKISMDEWVKFLTQTPIGSFKGYEYDPYWGKQSHETSYESKQVGKRVYLITQGGFQPSGTWSRTYQTYDKYNQQIVVLTITFSTVSKSEDLSCYVDVKDIFGSIEYLLKQY